MDLGMAHELDNGLAMAALDAVAGTSWAEPYHEAFQEVASGALDLVCTADTGLERMPDQASC